MGRPTKFRKISNVKPKYRHYQPEIYDEESSDINTMYLTAEEFEALRLRHYEQLKQTEAADKMAISQTTYSRIVSRAYEKLVKAFVEGFAISIQSHPLDKECPYNRKHRARYRRHPLSEAEISIKPQKVVFSGYGCSNCGYEWANPQENLDKKNDEKPVCPECGKQKVYRLIKKLTP